MYKITLQLECDKCGKARSFPTFEAHTHIIAYHMSKFRVYAAEEGWVSKLTSIHRMSDICPDCYEKELGGVK